MDPLDIHAKRPLAEHLADYNRYLTAKGNTPRHVSKTIARATACLDACRFIKLGDVQPSALLGFLADLRTAGKGIATANYYLTAVKGFTRWLWKDKRAAVDPLAGMSKLANAAADVRRVRRDLSPDEMGWLTAAAQSSEATFRGLAGADRRMLYLTAAGTGFRAAELSSLTPGAFALDTNPPTATAHAAYTKNGQTAVQPLPMDLAEALRGYLAGKPAGESVWPGCWADDGAEMIRRDLATARAAWLASVQDARQRAAAEQSDVLAYVDREGRYADFHALRHSYISRIVQSGASAKTAQTLARHSTVQLTLGRYAHASLLDLASAVESLPPILPAGAQAERQALRATGTEGAPGNVQNTLGLNLCLRQDVLGDSERQAETEAEASDISLSTHETLENMRFSRVSASGRGRTRTGTRVAPQGILSPQCLPFHHAAQGRWQGCAARGGAGDPPQF